MELSKETEEIRGWLKAIQESYDNPDNLPMIQNKCMVRTCKSVMLVGKKGAIYYCWFCGTQMTPQDTEWKVCDIHNQCMTGGSGHIRQELPNTIRKF